MLKAYVFLFLILGMTLFYVFLRDPCNRQLKADFSNKHPRYEILSSGAAEGSPESVHCHISYQKPDSEQIYEDIWLYEYLDSWKFSKVLETRTKEEAGDASDERPRDGDREVFSGGGGSPARLMAGRSADTHSPGR
ncbi:MAG: hypothetical protein JRE70_20295 [Deltaproteobacteria bacterium]|nr:hypothetical protein [Deltaproteobacteria bacterium]